MTKIKTTNATFCLKSIEDFINADSNAIDLEEKKVIAKKSLEHLGKIYGGNSDDISPSGCGRTCLSIVSEISIEC
jgi:hypothetical protein